MKTNIILSLFIISLVTISCDNKTKQKKTTTQNEKQKHMIPITLIKEIKQCLNDQTKMNDEDVETSYKRTSKDLSLTAVVIQEGLKNHGFKAISDETFNERIELIFGIKDLKSQHHKIHVTDDYITLFGQQFEDYPTLLNAEFEGFAETENYFLSRKEHLFFEFQSLPQLIKINDDNSYWITLKPYLFHRNNYLFYEDKVSLAWLINNDKPFLTGLVEKYGYDKDPRINKTVLDSLYKQHSQKNRFRSQLIANIFFIKDSFNKLQIREGLLKYVEDHTSSTDNRFLYALGYFMDSLYSEDRDQIFEEDPSKKFTELEKAKIVAYFTNIEIPAIEKYKRDQVIWGNATSTFYSLAQHQPQMVELIRKNNYFGLPKLKAMIDDTLAQIETDYDRYLENNQ